MALTKFSPDCIWMAYKYASEGCKNQEIAKLLGGLDKNTFCKWQNKREGFKNAIMEGRAAYKKAKNAPPSENLTDFIYGKLPEHLREIWNHMEKAYKKDPSLSITEVDELVQDSNSEAKQMLFFHAWYNCDFSVQRAKAMVNVTKKIWDSWQKDPDFLQLFDEMVVIKKDFFESKLVNLVKKGSASATVAANESFNSELYGKKQRLEVEGTVQHQHSHLIDLGSLPLPLEIKKQVLEAVREQKAIEDGESIPIDI